MTNHEKKLRATDAAPASQAAFPSAKGALCAPIFERIRQSLKAARAERTPFQPCMADGTDAPTGDLNTGSSATPTSAEVEPESIAPDAAPHHSASRSKLPHMPTGEGFYRPSEKDAGKTKKRGTRHAKPSAPNDKNQRSKRRGRLFTQLLLSFLLLTFIASMMIGILSSSLIRTYVQKSTLDTLMERAAVIAEMVVRPGGSLRVINVQQMDEWEKLTSAQLIFVDSNMQLITRQTVRNRRMTVTADRSETNASGEEADELLSSIDYELLSSLLAGDTVADVRTFDFMEGTWLFAGTPIISADTIDGAVLLCQALSETDYVTSSILYILIAALGLSIVLSLIISLLLTRRMVRPISAMRDTALKMANGQYGERVNVNDSTMEIAQLGDTLNRLSANLAMNIRSLQQEKDKMELILSGIGEGIIAVNLQNRLVHCNDAAQTLLELSDDDALLELPDLKDRNPLMGMLLEAMKTGKSAMGGWKNSAGLSVAASVSLISSGGDIVGAVGLVRDVSEAERLEQLRRDYVANISHELRTPLTGIRGMVEPLIDGVYDTEEERMECYRIIHQETLRLGRLITDMLDISRLQDGRIKLELEPMQVAGMLEAARTRLLNRAKEQHVDIQVAPDADPVVMGDEDRIMQVLIILLDNALKFTNSGGTITLATQLMPDHLVISVKDTGEGIAQEDLPYIFERFYKADKSRGQTKGTGLGLAIARLVTELMDGTIWCESEPGRGATFKFTLKLGEAR